MRDLASCYGEHAVKVTDSSCSGSGDAGDPSTCSAVSSSLFRTRLSTGKVLHVRVTWTSSLLGHGLSVGVEDPNSGSPAASSVLVRKSKGRQAWRCGDSRVALFWDLSSARYSSGPEPESGFSLLLSVDSEVVLMLGDGGGEREVMTGAAATRMVRRREQLPASRRALYRTTARFREGGAKHEIRIRCREEPGLSVYVDGRRVAAVKRLRWNFRGNRTVFVDGTAVDLMWDVYDWFFGGAAGRAAFMFRTRSGAETSLWLFEEEELLRGDKAFSLLVLASRAL